MSLVSVPCKSKGCPTRALTALGAVTVNPVLVHPQERRLIGALRPMQGETHRQAPWQTREADFVHFSAPSG